MQVPPMQVKEEEMVSIPRGSLLAVRAIVAAAPSDGVTTRIPHHGGGR